MPRVLALQHLNRVLVPAMAALGAAKLDKYIWAIDNRWNLIVVNVNITSRAGRQRYSLITAVHWLWDVKDYISFDFGRSETDDIPSSDPDIEEEFEKIVLVAKTRCQALQSQVADLKVAFEAVGAADAARKSDIRGLFHLYVLALLNADSEAESLRRCLVDLSHGPQPWKKRLRAAADSLSASASGCDLIRSVSEMVLEARALKKLPSLDYIFGPGSIAEHRTVPL